MTIQEAIKDIKSIKPIVGGKSLEIAIESMEELEQYRALGTVEELKELKQQPKTDWIPCEERLPDAEEEVYILAKRKYRDGDFKYITTTAMYEDGTIRENDSCWYWEDIEGEWDEEEDCYIIPKGWWECKHYNPDNCYNNAVDDEVIAWQPLPQPYKEEGA